MPRCLFVLLCALGLVQVVQAQPGAASAPVAASAAAAEAVAPLPVGQDVFMAGGQLRVGQPVGGDLLVLGGNVKVDAAVAGDVLVLGGQVRLPQDIGLSVHAAAGQLQLGGRVGRNLRLIGGQLELEPGSEVLGNVAVAGGELRLHGRVGGHVRATGGQLLIDGPVAGDVVAASGRVVLGPRAHIAGRLRYGSKEALERDPAARVDGGIEPMALRVGREGREHGEGREEGHEAERRWHEPGGGRWASAVWTLGLIALAMVLLALLPGLASGVSRRVGERPGISMLLGFALLLCVPVAAVLLFITLLGIPLGLVLLTLYLAVLPLAYVLGAIALGDRLLRGWIAAGRRPGLRRGLAAALALLALLLIGWIPVLGALLGLLVMLAGLGALVMQARPLDSLASGGAS